MRQPIAISLALTGARYSPWLDYNGKFTIPDEKFYAEHMPISTDEVYSDVQMAANKGALFFHMHARNPATGAQYANLGWYKGIASRIRALDPGFIFSFPTSRKMEVGKVIDSSLDGLQALQGTPPGVFDRAYYELKIRGLAVEARPDTLTTFTVPEVKMFGKPKNSVGVEDVPGWGDPEVMQLYYHGLIKRTKELGVMQEVEITTMGQFDVMKKMKASGDYYMDEPMHFVILLGFSNGLPINRETYETALANIAELRDDVDAPTVVTVGAVIRPEQALNDFFQPLGHGLHDYHEVMDWVVDDPRVDIFRVGLEDTPKMYGKQWTNFELVEHAVDFFNDRGIGIMTDPKELRQVFGLPERGAIQQDSSNPVSVAPLFPTNRAFNFTNQRPPIRPIPPIEDLKLFGDTARFRSSATGDLFRGLDLEQIKYIIEPNKND